MKKCCGEETKSDPVTNFIKNLRNLWEAKNKNVKENILLKIKRRITLSDNVQEKEQDFKSFIKQKIVEEKKEGGCCHCCDCFWKKPIGDLGGKPEEKKEEGEGGAQEGDEDNK